MRACPQCPTSNRDDFRFCTSCGAELPAASARREDPMIGRMLAGGYLVQHLAGIGGMGRVYVAEQTALGRTVAVKVIHPHLAGEETTAGRFITEARAASQLRHPNSIGIYDFGRTDDGQLYLVMELLRGKDLARVTHEEGPLDFQRIVGILRQTLAALEEAHALSIIHRDLKPENIILEPARNGRDFVKVVDYGLAKMRETAPGAAVTTPGFVCGTPEYMSPEQGRGDPLDARSDLYSVGVMLFELLTGRLPFEAETPTKLLLAHLNELPPDPREIAPERAIPDALAQAALRALAKPRDLRFRSAREFEIALACAIDPAYEDESLLESCATCHAKNAPSQKYCGECGASIRPPALDDTVSMRTPRFAAPPPPPARAALELEHVTLTRAPATSSLLGRDDEIAWLLARRDDARAMPCAARIAGERGMGKSRLLGDFLARASGYGDRVVHVRAREPMARGEGLRDAIRKLSPEGDDFAEPTSWSGATTIAMRGFADLFAGESSGPAIERRRAALEALRWSLVRASKRAEGALVILAVDDLDLLDGVSRNAFADLVVDPPVARALLVVTYERCSIAAPVAPGELRVLGPLPESVCGLLLAHAPERPLSPLELEQFLRFQREQPSAVPADDADALLGARVASLSPAALHLLRAISVAGDGGFDLAWRALCRDLDDDACAHALGELKSMGFVDEDELAHAAFRDAALASTPDVDRRKLHAAMLEAGEEAMSLEARAHHAYHAGHAFQGLLWLDELAAAQRDAGDYDGAILSLRRAVRLARADLARGEMENALSAVVLFTRKLADALAEVEAYADAEGLLREALDLVPPVDRDRAQILAALARVALARKQQNEARGYLAEALTIARKSDARELVASLESLRRQIA